MPKTFGAWAVNPEVGYLYATEVANQIFYGVVIANEASKPWEPLFEVHVDTWLDGTGSTTLLNAGVRYTVSETLDLLGALGRTVTEPAAQEQELDVYVGAQLAL